MATTTDLATYNSKRRRNNQYVEDAKDFLESELETQDLSDDVLNLQTYDRWRRTQRPTTPRNGYESGFTLHVEEDTDVSAAINDMLEEYDRMGRKEQFTQDDGTEFMKFVVAKN